MRLRKWLWRRNRNHKKWISKSFLWLWLRHHNVNSPKEILWTHFSDIAFVIAIAVHENVMNYGFNCIFSTGLNTKNELIPSWSHQPKKNWLHQVKSCLVITTVEIRKILHFVWLVSKSARLNHNKPFNKNYFRAKLGVRQSDDFYPKFFSQSLPGWLAFLTLDFRL